MITKDEAIALKYTTDQAIALARKVGLGFFKIKNDDRTTVDVLTALCNKVERDTLLKAAEYLETYAEPDSASYVLRRMAGESE